MSSAFIQQKQNFFGNYGDFKEYNQNLSASHKTQPLFNIQEVRVGQRGSTASNNMIGSELVPFDNSKFRQGRSMNRALNSAGRPQPISYPGQLPTLGLNRYKNVEIKNDQKNPFSIQKETEKLLVVRERERELKDLNKLKKEGLRVFQKSIQTRQDRSGKIREFNNIKPNGKSHKGEQLAIMNVSQDEMRENNNKQKLNIFDEQDSSVLKYETLARLGIDDRALVESETKSILSNTTSVSNALADQQRPKAIEYLSKGREQKESVRDFIDNSRKILASQIAINDKSEETERLKEYIIMEREKLDEAKKTFEEDKERFTKYMEDLQNKAEETTQEVVQLTQKKNKKLAKIQKLTLDIQATRSEIKRQDEQLVIYKQRKRFLDMLAINAGKKQIRPKNPTAGSKDNSKNESQNNSRLVKPKIQIGNTFVTQDNQQPSSYVFKNLSNQKQDEGIQEFEPADDDQDFEIYFDKTSLLEHLSHLEEDNLFKIHLVQEDEQALEKLRKSIEFKLQQKKDEINDVQNNINMLLASQAALKSKQAFLDLNMKVKQESVARNNSIGETKPTAEKKTEVQRQSTLGQYSGEDKNNALTMLQQQYGCSKEQINRLSQLISILLEKTGIKQDDQSDKIEMLRKIEVRLNFLVEARDYISTLKKKELDEKEQKLHNQRRDQKIKKKKLEDQLMQEERQRKNMARIRKQEEFKIFKGRKDMQRAKKADLKPKEKNEEKPSDEILDQFTYIGFKVYDGAEGNEQQAQQQQ